MAEFVVETKDDIGSAITDMLRMCAYDGMTFPVILCAVSPNGSIYASRFDGLGGSEPLAEHFEGEGFALPMTLMVLDQNNVVAKAAIKHSGNMIRQ